MASQDVLVTYSAPPAFLTSPDWANIRSSIRAHLPLKNLHWKAVSRPSLRTIQSVDVNLIPLDTSGPNKSSLDLSAGAGGVEGRTSLTPGSCLAKPLLNVFFVTCEDAETYKMTVKKQIQTWVTLVSSRKNQEWIIVLVVRPDSTTGAARVAGAGRGLFTRGGSLLDRIKTDFNVAKKDRCVQLSRPAFPNPDEPSLWMDLISKMKDGIVASFDASVVLREEEIKAMEAMRTMPGWNFCTFFILKESLAYSFEGMNLFEDAIIQYDELEASFFQVLKERNLSWFGSLGGTHPSDDSLSILSVKSKPYRDMILANSISVFDFRIYVFARQCKMLGRMGRIGEVLEKGREFVVGFGKYLEENSPDGLSQNFLESWTYSSSLDIVDTCNKWKSQFPLSGGDANEASAIMAGNAELYRLAQRQLVTLGIRSTHFPPSFSSPSVDFSLPTPSSALTADPSTIPSPGVISRGEILAAWENEEAFDSLFYRTTARAIECFQSAGMERSTLGLQASLAILDSLRSRHSSAHSRYRVLSSHFAAYRWPLLEAFHLAKSLRTHAAIEAPRDAIWIGEALTFLKSVVAVRGAGKDGKRESGSIFAEEVEEDLKELVSGLVDGLRITGRELSREHAIHDHPAFSVRPLSKRAQLTTEEDGSTISFEVTSRLPCVVTVDDIRVCLAGQSIDSLWFKSGRTSLEPGPNTVLLFCPMPVSGLFTLETSQIRLSRITLNRTWVAASSTPSGNKLFLPDERTPLVRIPKDGKALHALVELPLELKLDSMPTILLCVHTGRNTVTKAVVSLRVAEDELVFSMGDAQAVDYDAPFSIDEDKIILEDLEPESKIMFSIPYRGTPRGTTVSIRISIDYYTSFSPLTQRAFRLSHPLVLSLPLAVNVQDIFRSDCLFSKFTLSSDGFHHLRIKDASLVGAEKTVDIQSTGKSDGSHSYVLPRAPASYLFRLALKGPESQEHDTLHLTIRYRTLTEEIRLLLLPIVSPLLPTTSLVLVAHKSWILQTLLDSITSVEGWAERYLATGWLEVPDVREEDLERVVKGLVGDDGDEQEHGSEQGGGAKMELMSAWERAVEAVDAFESPASGPDLPWRELEIPVDVPLRQIVSSVQISVNTPGPFVVGQTLRCTMIITCSTGWSGGDPLEKLEMCYDLGTDFEHWLISGKKKGNFAVNSGETFTASFTLIPIHHGSLSLPKVLVHPSSSQPAISNSAPNRDGLGANGGSSSPSFETYISNAEQRVDVAPPMMGRSTFVVGVGPAGGGRGWDGGVPKGWVGNGVGVEG